MCFSYGGLHNGHCAKWKCNAGSSTTAGRCESKTSNIGKCIKKSGIVSSYLSEETVEEICDLANSSSDCQRAIAPLQSLCRDYDRGTRGNRHENRGVVWVDYAKISDILPSSRNRNQKPCDLKSFHIAVVDSDQPPQCEQGKVRFCPSFAMDYREWQDPFCQRQEPVNCASLLENSCKSQSSSCTRKPGSSSTTTGYKCIRQDGQPATAADCDPTWIKPSCGDNQQYHCIERVPKCIRKPEYNNWNSSQRFRPMPGCYCNNGRQAPFDECAKVNKDPSCQYGFMQSGYPLPLYNCQQTPSVAPKCLWVCDHAINNCDNRYCEQVSFPTLEECSSYNTQLTCNQDAGCSRVRK